MWHLSHDRTTLLDKIEEGETVELVGFGANGPSSLRLAELGLNPNTRITVLKSTRGQPMIIGVRGSRLAIDRQTAHQIRVRRVMGRRRAHHKRPRHGGSARGRRQRRHRRIADLIRNQILGQAEGEGRGKRAGRRKKKASD